MARLDPELVAEGADPEPEPVAAVPFWALALAWKAAKVLELLSAELMANTMPEPQWLV